MKPKKITIETLEADQRWANVVAPTIRETLNNLRKLQHSEGEKQARAWLKDEYYDLEDDEDAGTSRSD